MRGDNPGEENPTRDRYFYGYVALLSTVARWFNARRGIMSGIIKVGTGLGMVIAPLFITMIMKICSWRTTFFILGTIII